MDSGAQNIDQRAGIQHEEEQDKTGAINSSGKSRGASLHIQFISSRESKNLREREF